MHTWNYRDKQCYHDRRISFIAQYNHFMPYSNLKKYWGITILLSEDDLYPQEIIYGMCAGLLALIFVNAFEIENLMKQFEKLQN